MIAARERVWFEEFGGKTTEQMLAIYDARNRDAARWRAYVRYMLSKDIVAPRLDLIDAPSFDKFADALIERELKGTPV